MIFSFRRIKPIPKNGMLNFMNSKPGINNIASDKANVEKYRLVILLSTINNVVHTNRVYRNQKDVKMVEKL